MKIDAVGVATTNMRQTIRFYSVLGFDFSGIDPEAPHIEPKTPDGSARLMIDKIDIIQDIINEDPKPSNHSLFAIRYATPKEVNEVCDKLIAQGYSLFREPWDAFWDQRYAVVEDPDGYRMDLYADL